jgi:hypothetical protein
LASNLVGEPEIVHTNRAKLVVKRNSHRTSQAESHGGHNLVVDGSRLEELDTKEKDASQVDVFSKWLTPANKEASQQRPVTMKHSPDQRILARIASYRGEGLFAAHLLQVAVLSTLIVWVAVASRVR